MSVQDLEGYVQRLSGADLQKFAEWFDNYREATILAGEQNVDNIPEAQKQELLRRQTEYLSNPEIATAWDDGFFNRLRQRLADVRS